MTDFGLASWKTHWQWEDFSLALLEDGQELGVLFGFRGKRLATRDSRCGSGGFSGATHYTLLVAVSSGRNRQRKHALSPVFASGFWKDLNLAVYERTGAADQFQILVGLAA